MRGRTQFWLGSVALAVVLGLLGGGVITPQTAVGQDELVGNTSMRYSMVLGLPGSTERSQTLYLIDDLNDIFYILEYTSKSRSVTPRKIVDLRKYSTEVIHQRARRDTD